MTTVWLLLLVVVASSQVVGSQSTTDETCSGGESPERVLQQLQTVLDRLGIMSTLNDRSDVRLLYHVGKK